MSKSLISIQEIDSQIKYWFVRTDKGKYFGTYLENDFIGIGWNEITLHDLKNSSDEVVKQKISRTEKIPLDSKGNRSKVSAIYNKLLNFTKLRKGDIIFIPSENSSQLAFGQVLDDVAYVDSNQTQGCEYYKRRKIKWLTSGLNIESLDPTFLKIRTPRHAISEVSKEHQYFIDSIIYDLYKKDNSTHLVLRVKTQDEINLLQLAEVLKGLHNLMSIVNEEFKLHEDVSSGSIRINLQSPGLFNIKQAGYALGLVACLLGFQSCSISPTESKKVEHTRSKHQPHIDSLLNHMNNLQIPT